MIKLSSLMQEVFSTRMREYITFSVKKPLYAFLMGILSTILFQSSSATTLLTISLVSAGLISFYHSLGIILGADIGTTLTVQLVVWKITSISPIIITVGGILFFLGNEKWKKAGELLIYFGIIFFGLYLISFATAPLKQHKGFIDFFHKTKNPLLGIGIGVVFTGIVQASAIPISILTIMGQQGLISIENALPIVLGANIGTTVTAIVGSIAANINGKRSAAAHFFFKLLGVGICLVFLPVFVTILKSFFTSIAQQIAFGHFLFNLLITIVFMFLLKPFSVLIERILPGKDETMPLWPEFLDTKCLVNPEDALVCVKKELTREIMLAERMLRDSLKLIFKFRGSIKKDIMYTEIVVDNLQTEITKYLWSISCGQLTPELAKKLFAFSAIVYEIERIGDRSTNIVELSESKHDRNALFTDAAKEELRHIGELITKILMDTASIIENQDENTIRVIFELNRRIAILIKKATEQHLERFYQKLCRAEAGPIFVDMLVNLERISYHCQSIAEQIGRLNEE